MRKLLPLLSITVALLSFQCSSKDDEVPAPSPSPTPQAEKQPSYQLSKDGRTFVKLTSSNTTSLDFTAINELKRVENIADSAFAGHRSLTTIVLPNTVENIGTKAFKGCTALSSITFPANEKFKYIRYKCFEECKSLNKVVLPNTVSEIESFAFADAGLTSVKLSENLVYIKEQAFAGNKELKEITIPKTVGQIGTAAFIDTKLTLVNVLAVYPPRINLVQTAQGWVGPFPATLKEIKVPKIATDDYRYEDKFWSVYAYYINREIPFKPLKVSETNISVKVGEQYTISILSGSDKYGLKRAEETKAIAYIAITPDNKILGVRGIKEGNFQATLYDRVSREEITLSIHVTN